MPRKQVLTPKATTAVTPSPKAAVEEMGLPAHVDAEKFADALKIMQSIHELRGSDDPNAMVSPEDMAMIGEAMAAANITPQEFFSLSERTPEPMAPNAEPKRKLTARDQRRQLQHAPQPPPARQQHAPQQRIKSLHKDEAKASAFARMLEERLKPAHNEYDKKEAAQAQLDLLTERVRGANQRTAVAGAATDASRRAMRMRAKQVRRVIQALLRAFSFDTKLLERRMRRDDGNWLEALHRKLYDSVPAAFSRIYRTLDEGALRRLPASAAEAALVDRFSAGEHSFLPLRKRGLIASIMGEFGVNLLLHPLTHGVSFAVPSEEALRALAQHGPLVEVGAGTGYWSAVLKHRDVDVLAYDAAPPTAENANGFFDTQFTEVLQADASALFRQQPQLARERALLIVWPNNPEAEGEKGQPVVWDINCLRSYIAAGGRTVAYVGERGAAVQVLGEHPTDYGISSSRAFQEALAEQFELAACVASRPGSRIMPTT